MTYTCSMIGLTSITVLTLLAIGLTHLRWSDRPSEVEKRVIEFKRQALRDAKGKFTKYLYYGNVYYEKTY